MASRATAADPVAPAEKATEETHSGRLLLRMPQSLHGELARAAEQEGVSLNAYITAALSASIGWRAGERTERDAGASPLLRAALVADLVLVAVAVIAAVVLLLVAVV
jgi:HicB family